MEKLKILILNGAVAGHGEKFGMLTLINKKTTAILSAKPQVENSREEFERQPVTFIDRIADINDEKERTLRLSALE